jgi:hypothetical protein
VSGANAADDAEVDVELPAYQRFSVGYSTLTSPRWTPASMGDEPALAKLKKILAGHCVSGVS